MFQLTVSLLKGSSPFLHNHGHSCSIVILSTLVWSWIVWPKFSSSSRSERVAQRTWLKNGTKVLILFVAAYRVARHNITNGPGLCITFIETPQFAFRMC
ncbi:hypothetical protein PILCRDRAFT_628860 [Piloderma croceum F 1598]|uniref:Uncharacterized protein n=1 Tax=Piloderma croceum (strain F 1598) TaxID=765440 RepID=A0A0C3BIJ3_PILCF|nr:hypothetical protein PILCRDRAFT_628860 [Piloderma croceum F 1598]